MQEYKRTPDAHPTHMTENLWWDLCDLPEKKFIY